VTRVPASAFTCPLSADIATHDGKTYVADFVGVDPFAGSVEATVYTVDSSYSLAPQPLSDGTASNEAFRVSRVVAFVNPSTAAVTGIAWTLSGPETNETCRMRQTVPQPTSSNENVRIAADFRQLAVGNAPPLLAFEHRETPLACAEPFVDAKIVGLPVEPDYPMLARNLGQTGTVHIQVAIDPTGAVVNAKIARSSGSVILDGAALTAAQKTQYAPQIFRCEAVPGTFTYRADFTAG
jgi:TonB family protein